MGDFYTKTGIPVRKVLQENCPPLQEIEFYEPIKLTFEFYRDVSDAVPLDIYNSDVEFAY